MGKKESDFQGDLIKKLKQQYPGCMVLKNDPTYIQGIPDLLVLYGQHWAALECKRSKADFRRSLKKNKNQRYYVDKMNGMSYASFIYPENEEEVLNEIQSALQS